MCELLQFNKSFLGELFSKQLNRDVINNQASFVQEFTSE